MIRLADRRGIAVEFDIEDDEGRPLNRRKKLGTMHAEPCSVGWLPRLAAPVVALLLGLETIPLVAAAAGPFDGLAGLWSGSGTVTYASGTKERLSCRVQYVQENVDNLQQALRCASDSYKFEINVYFDHANGKIAGIWSELTMDVRGTVSGTVNAGRIQGALEGPGFVAELVVNTRGDRQHVLIEAEVEEIRSVDIEVRKTGR